MIDYKKVKVKITTDGGYDGMYGVELPIVVDGYAAMIGGEMYGLIDIPVINLIPIGYDKEKGLCNYPGDYSESDPILTFYLDAECEVLNESV